MNVCAFARIACDHANATLSVLSDDMPTSWQQLFRWFYRIFRGRYLRFFATNMTVEHFRHSLRHAVAILMGFHIGRFGIEGVISPYDPGCANTISLLLTPNDTLGSAVKRNLDRISGVVLGTVVGQIVYAVFRRCTPVDMVMSGTCLYWWMVGTLLMRYNVPLYSMIGKLLAAFGAKNMLTGCSQGGFEAQAAYSSIVNTALSIVVLVFVDTLSWEPRASSRAYPTIVEVFDSLRTKVNSLFAPWESNDKTDAKRLGTKQLLAVATELAREAFDEPRVWRVPWRNETCDAALLCAKELESMISMSEYSVLGNTSSQLPVAPVAADDQRGTLEAIQSEKKSNERSAIDQRVYDLLLLEPLQKLQRLLQGELNQLKEMLSILEHEEYGRFSIKAENLASAIRRGEFAQLRDSFVAEANMAEMMRVGQCDGQSLEYDHVAQVSLLLAVADLMMADLQRLHLQILRGL